MKRKPNRRGFALILAISAMAFMVLLTLTLSSVITSKLRLLNAQKEMRTARSNAILGIGVALSELQRTLGKDNAISFSSSIFDADPTTPEIDDVLSPYVLGTISLEKDNSSVTPLELQKEQRAIVQKIRDGGNDDSVNWLVSGQKRMMNPLKERSESLSADNVILAEFSILSEYPSTFGGLVSAENKNRKVQIRAGKVPFSLNSGNNTSDSAYAWWISDESQKAKLNLVRPEKYLGKEMGNINGRTAHADSRIPQISNLYFVEELSELNINPFTDSFSEENVKILGKMSSLDELAIADPTLSEWAKNNKNDWSASSVGIPADVAQGRLKEDLTQYISGGYGLNDRDGIIREGGKGDYNGVNFGLENYIENLPRFGLIKTWAEFAEKNSLEKFDDGVDASVPNMGDNPNHGISPIVSQVLYVFIPAFESASANGLYDLKSPVKLSLVMYPKIYIWNPHNVKINAANYTIRLYMPLLFSMSATTNYSNVPVKAYTTWVKSGTSESEIVEYEAAEKSPLSFANFLKTRADNGNPVMTFQVRNLALRPGENVQLILSPDATKGSNGIAEYQDKENLAANDNLLVPGKLERNSGSDKVDVVPGCGIRVKLGQNNTELEMQSKVPTALETATQDGKYLTAPNPDDPSKPITYVPFSHGDGKEGRVRTILHGTTLSADAQPYLQCWWYVRGGADKNVNPKSYTRYGHELLLENEGRLIYADHVEWTSPSTVSDVTNVDRYRHEPAQGFNRAAITLDALWNHRDTPKAGSFGSMAINDIKFFEDITFSSDDFWLNKFMFMTNTPGGSVSYTASRDSFYSGGGIKAFGYKVQDLQNTITPIFTALNQRASATTSGNMDISATIKRPESKVGNRRGHGVAQKYTQPHTSVDVFFGRFTVAQGFYAWPAGSKIPKSVLQEDDLYPRYSQSANDGHSERYAHTVLLAGHSSYGYDIGVCAPFEIPRDKFDLMSLGAFSHMNFSNIPWHPSWQLGESYASPYLDREKIIEPKIVNTNEVTDISFILNASMWDRFYLSTMYEKEMPEEVKAGMRLPNTRYFIKNLPADKSELYGSDKAFKNSAAYVGIDGMFNVNSTSYEAWRAFLGGMLGTQKKTLVGGVINEKGNDTSDSSEFKMPNPGTMNALALPVNDSAANSIPKELYTYKDLIVGRNISDAELDQLTREIIAEVKRRAPFFSLSDFINRRLMKFADATDIDLKYQSLMGTIAAAIHRSTQDTNRPKNFFNSQEFDEFKDKAGDKFAKSGTFSRDTSIVSAHDNFTNRDSWKDLGEHVKDAKDEYIEQAVAAPREAGIWNSSLDSSPGMLKQRDILSMIAPFISVRGDTYTIRAYGESKNPMTGVTSKTYCEAIVQRSSEPVDSRDDIVAPESPFGRRFNVVSFRWLTPAEL